jgi:hypothetical protein
MNGTKRSRKRVRPKQLELDLPMWGGARKGAGRKRIAAKKRVRHRKRALFDKAHPVHVTLRMRGDVPSLRTREAWAVIVRVLRAARLRHGLSVNMYSVLGNHLHLIVEHEGGQSLSLGMRVLCTMLAARLNVLFGRRGPVLADRYHARALTTPLEVRRAIAYVLTKPSRCTTSLSTRNHKIELLGSLSGAPVGCGRTVALLEARHGSGVVEVRSLEDPWTVR